MCPSCCRRLPEAWLPLGRSVYTKLHGDNSEFLGVERPRFLHGHTCNMHWVISCPFVHGFWYIVKHTCDLATPRPCSNSRSSLGTSATAGLDFHQWSKYYKQCNFCRLRSWGWAWLRNVKQCSAHILFCMFCASSVCSVWSFIYWEVEILRTGHVAAVFQVATAALRELKIGLRQRSASTLELGVGLDCAAAVSMPGSSSNWSVELKWNIVKL